MLKLTVLVAVVALSLKVDARTTVIRRGVSDNEVQGFEVKAPWHGHADQGYPEFDGNPYKQTLVELSSMLANIAADSLDDVKDVPPVIKYIVEGAKKTNWNSFEEYLDYWGAAQIALMEAIENEQSKNLEYNLIEPVVQKRSESESINDMFGDEYDT